jgi:hypothetical protein
MTNARTVRLPIYLGQNGELVYLSYDKGTPIIVMPAETSETTMSWVREWVKALLREAEE